MKRLTFLLLLLALTGCAQKNSTPMPAKAEENTEEAIKAEKPVIYLYGYNNEQVTVKLDLKGRLTSAYPEYDEDKGWVVTAKSDGTLESKDKKNNYPYLYWEGVFEETEFDFSKGFCIKGSETAEKLNAILKDIGLNDKERCDFITYWLPQMEGNEYNVIAFQTKAYLNIAKLDITPKPKTTTRVFMAWYPSQSEVDIKEQKFNQCPRTDKYCIEWGGVKVSSVDLKPVTSITKSDGEEADNTEITDFSVTNLITVPLEENARLQQEYVQRIQNLQLAAYQIMSGQAPAVTAGPHSFTDKNGKKATFTDAEWKKLQSVWSHTGNADEMIKQHTIEELNQLLGK